MIGSITKSMTATVVGTRVDDDILDWYRHYERDVHVFARGGDLLVRTRYGTHVFRPTIDDEDLFLSIDNVDTGTRLSPERDPESGRVTRLIVRAPEAAGRLQTATVLERRARCDWHLSTEDEWRYRPR